MINLEAWYRLLAAKWHIALSATGPDDVRYKVPETAAIGHAPPGPSAAVADDGLD